VGGFYIPGMDMAQAVPRIPAGSLHPRFLRGGRRPDERAPPASVSPARGDQIRGAGLTERRARGEVRGPHGNSPELGRKRVSQPSKFLFPFFFLYVLFFSVFFNCFESKFEFECEFIL
jgi:hypothetical protein